MKSLRAWFGSRPPRVRYYGSCPDCGHDWREHPGGLFGEPADGSCGECQYEFAHDQRETEADACRRAAQASPGRSVKKSTAPGSPVTPTVIVGVADDPRQDLASGGHGLYEFVTADGVPVNLHDSTLVSVQWEPVRRRLGFRFEAEREVLMEFEGVVILEWSQDNGGFEAAPDEVVGQVSDFSYDGRDGFELVTAQSVIGFTATGLVVAT